MKIFSKTIFSLLFILSMACGKPQPDEVVAVIGEKNMTVGDLQKSLRQELTTYPSDIVKNKKTFLNIKKRTLQAMIERRLLLSEALKQGTAVDEEEVGREIQKFKSRYTEVNFQNMLQEAGITPQEWLERKKQNLIIKKYVDQVTSVDQPITSEQIKAFYEENPEEFKKPESVHVRQIVTDSKEKAESIMRRLRNGENFAKLAMDLSLSPDRKQGGDLGFIVKGSFPREFEICFQMNPGEVSPIIPSAYGFHLFKVLAKSPEQTPPLEKVEGKIAMEIRLRARQEGREKLIGKLRAQQPIEINEKVLARIQL